MNGFYRQGDPSAWKDMTLTSINAPIRIGRATVLAGDLVIAKADRIIFVPAPLAAGAIMNAEFTNLEDAFNFELNASGENGAEFKGGWTAAKHDALAKWIEAIPFVWRRYARFYLDLDNELGEQGFRWAFLVHKNAGDRIQPPENLCRILPISRLCFLHSRGGWFPSANCPSSSDGAVITETT